MTTRSEIASRIRADERLRVYLTNTLEPITAEPDQKELWPVPALAAEIKEAQAVKEQPILVRIILEASSSAHSTLGTSSIIPP